jgi:hypothetical protein
VVASPAGDLNGHVPSSLHYVIQRNYPTTPANIRFCPNASQNLSTRYTFIAQLCTVSTPKLVRGTFAQCARMVVAQ